MRMEAPQKILAIRHEQCASVGLLGSVLKQNAIPSRTWNRFNRTADRSFLSYARHAF